MERFFVVLEKLFEKLKIKDIVISFLFAGIIILFFPISFINMLGLQTLRNKFRSTIGACVLICGMLCLIWFVYWIKRKILSLSYKILFTAKRYLKKIISIDEKAYLIAHFYDFDRNEFFSTSVLDITDGRTSLLENAYIIARTTDTTFDMLNFSFCIHPNVRLYLNRALKKRKIVITQDSLKWDL